MEIYFSSTLSTFVKRIAHNNTCINIRCPLSNFSYVPPTCFKYSSETQLDQHFSNTRKTILSIMNFRAKDYWEFVAIQLRSENNESATIIPSFLYLLNKYDETSVGVQSKYLSFIYKRS